MRKSFELIDWMKEHFGGNGSTPGEPGQPGILYRFTHGLKETGGVVKVDEGNGLAVNEHTGMLEVPIGEHLSYTSQGIDAKEGDTAQKGVVQLSNQITPESTHETAATPQAVKEYVDANAGGGSYTFQAPLQESDGNVSVNQASAGKPGVVTLMTANLSASDTKVPTTSAVVQYVNKYDVRGDKDNRYTGRGSLWFKCTNSDTNSQNIYFTSQGINDIVGTNLLQINRNEAVLGNARVDAISSTLKNYVAVAHDGVRVVTNDRGNGFEPLGFTHNGNKVITAANLATKASPGVVVMEDNPDALEDGKCPTKNAIGAVAEDCIASNNEAVFGRKFHVRNGLAYEYDGSPEGAGVLLNGVLADEQNLGVVKLTHTVSHGEHPNEAVSPDGVAAYVDAKVADAGGFSIVKAMQATPDFKLIDGSMVQSGKLVYGVLTFTCTVQKSITDIASLPLMPKSPFTVKVVRMSNNPVEYEATVGDNGNIAFSSAQNVQTGTYAVTIAMQTK